MAAAKRLTVCELHKQGFCHIEKAGHKVSTQGLVKGVLCKGTVCEDFEYRYICSFYPIEQVK